jgi:hypothetical protein
LILVELNLRAAILLETFLYKRVCDLSDECGFETLKYIPLSFG